MTDRELNTFLNSGEVMGEPAGLNDEIIDFILKMNGLEDQRSFFCPDDREEIEELVEEGAALYVVRDENGRVTACAIADPIEDNETVEISGPFGDTRERMGLLRRIKADFKGYEALSFVSRENELSRCFKVLSNECYMDVTAGNYGTEGVAEYDGESLELHDRVFPDAYANAETLKDEYDILVYRQGDELIGYIAYEAEEGYIDFVAVEPDYRRRGIAGKLVKAALNDMEGEKVHLTVESLNTGAIELYKSLGFELRHNMLLLRIE